jgi:hypothetical protein
MSKAHKNDLARSIRLPQSSNDVLDRRERRSAIVNPDQRFFETQLDRWMNEGGAITPRESDFPDRSQRACRAVNASLI